ncbi:hypothetical protein [Streptomyces sp. NPDC051677]|uniref:hypothetical protein n=1 Tax=Streptomyces sp. NPDC051677 TaxID=3365669 RepID=UPI0037D98AB0
MSIRRTPDFDDDLAVLQRGGLSASDAVRQAVRLIAQAHRTVDDLTARNGDRPGVLSIRVTDLTSAYDTPQERHTAAAPTVRRGGGEGR